MCIFGGPSVCCYAKKNYTNRVDLLVRIIQVFETQIASCLFAPGQWDETAQFFCSKLCAPVFQAVRANLKLKTVLGACGLALHLLRPFLWIDMMKFPQFCTCEPWTIFSGIGLCCWGKDSHDILWSLDSQPFSERPIYFELCVHVIGMEKLPLPRS